MRGRVRRERGSRQKKFWLKFKLFPSFALELQKFHLNSHFNCNISMRSFQFFLFSWICKRRWNERTEKIMLEIKCDECLHCFCWRFSFHFYHFFVHLLGSWWHLTHKGLSLLWLSWKPPHNYPNTVLSITIFIKKKLFAMQPVRYAWTSLNFFYHRLLLLTLLFV